ncbi:Aspartic proteinase CDR1 [Glycine soja]|uniref:Aspartic proteinase CDR1 n=1 Tax=Glycine soja TaxID=3848 RepID=A0A445HVS1_GLYSO|nr:Aspartic proteinase CDR1 [Glycine soja]
MVNFIAFANHNNFTVYHLFQCRDDLTNNQCSLCMSHAITQLNNIYFISYDSTLQFDNGFIKAYNAGLSVKHSLNSPFYKSNKLHMHRPGSFYQVPKKSYASNGPFTRVTSNNGDYLMKLTLGTPPVDVSKTYAPIPCDSKECNSFFDHSCSPEKACDYVYAYADDSATKGMLAKEIATFSSTDGKPIVESIIFGCGHNTGVFNENDMGLIGLDPHTSGTISLGDASDVSGEGVVTTPLVSEEGTPETYLPQEFYDRLVEELKVQINLPPIHVDPDLGTQLCYKSETNLEGPILTAHFEGADVKLMPIQTFIPPKDGVFCFAMTGTTDGLYIFDFVANLYGNVDLELRFKYVTGKNSRACKCKFPKKSYAPNGAFTRVTSNNGDYLMKLTLGTPPVDVYGLVDTGSFLVWAQCTPCYGCYKQKSSMFEPLRSNTYTPIPCDSEECNSLFGNSCSPQKLCAYSYAYADSSVTKGVLAREIVSFSSTNGEPVVGGDIIFGCGHSNSGIFNENDMGIIGLGGGPLSLVPQFGEGVATTPLVSEQVTPATYLPQKFYDRLVEELKVQINLPPIHDDPDLGTQFCYRSETNLEGPILTAHFEGADVQLMPIQTFIPPKDGVFCFAMAGTTDGEYIFGNFAQSNVLIGFDLDRRTVSYKATDCTNR